MVFLRWPQRLAAFLLLAALPVRVFANDTLSTDGFTQCIDNPSISVTALNITFNRATREVVFDVGGTSSEQQEVTAALSVNAYGKQIYQKTFNPCDPANKVPELCPAPKGTFAAVGSMTIPEQYVNMIPSIAYTVPDLGGASKLQLFAADGKPVACVDAAVGNGRTMKVPAVQYAAIGVAGAALVVSGLSALSTSPGGAASSPTFTETFTWFQSMAMNGMLSVNYPGIYRSFSQNFAFSTGLIPWNSMQISIDNFRARTGGNLTNDSVQYLQNATLVYTDGSSNSVGSVKRGLGDLFDGLALVSRDVQGTVNGTTKSVGDGGQVTNGTSDQPTSIATVSGIKAFSEELLIPQSNTFMTVLLFFAIVLAAVTASILLFKVILEAWALFGTFPKKLEGFRKRYWWLLAKTITNLILALYSVWVLYCIYQFKIGDSWAAKILAGVTLGLFTAILVAFTIIIWSKARKAKKMNGDTSALFEDKEIWVRYSIFYDTYKRSYWWLFVPIIIFSFARGCVIASAEGHGMAQCAGQLIVDAILLLLLLFLRPYSRGSGNWINIIIQVVRVLSVACILVFVEELGISQTTQTILGVVLIVLQAVLTAVLAILIAVNALINCIKMNPHRKARKDAEKAKLAGDELTPLDAHDSWLMSNMDQKKPGFQVDSMHTRGRSQNGYDEVPGRDVSREPLARSGASMGGYNHDRTRSHSRDDGYLDRQPQLPILEYQGRGIAL